MEEIPYTYEEALKIVFIGNYGVGKTTTLAKILNRDIQRRYTEFYFTQINFDDKIIRLMLWDSQYEDRMNRLVTGIEKMTHALVLMYDITNSQSFHDLAKWIAKLEEKTLPKYCKFFVVGNKLDRASERKVDESLGKELAESLNADFFEMSAKTEFGIGQWLQTVIRDFVELNEKQITEISGKYASGNCWKRFEDYDEDDDIKLDNQNVFLKEDNKKKKTKEADRSKCTIF